MPTPSTLQFKKPDIDVIGVDEFANFSLEPKKFEVYQHDFPCVESKEEEEGKGFYYIKIHKTASTTTAEVVRNIADRKKKSHHRCAQQFGHKEGNFYPGLRNRTINQPDSFLFTIIREPTSRALSDYFYTEVIQRNQTVEAESFKLSCCRRNYHLMGQAGHQVAFMSTEQKLPEGYFWEPQNPELIRNPHALMKRVDNLFYSYDFIGISEQLNESLVILSFLLNLTVADIAYQSHRNSSNKYVMGREKQCFRSVSQTEGMTGDLKEYIQSAEWKARISADTLLYNAACEAMQNTINEVIGREAFEERLKNFEQLLDLLGQCTDECEDCSSTGKFRDMNNNPQCLQCKRAVIQSWEKEQQSKQYS